MEALRALPDSRPRVHRDIARLKMGGPAMHVVHLQEGLTHPGYDTRLIAGDITLGEGDTEHFARQHGVKVSRVPHLGRKMKPSQDLRTLLTPGQRQELVQDFQLAPSEKFAVVPLGLDLQRFAGAQSHESPVALKVRLGLDPGIRLVGIVGRLVLVKNHHRLLRALLQLPAHIRVAVVGVGELEGKLRRLAEELGVDERVHWLGWQTDVTEIYPGLDALALDVGTPVAVLEALAARVPVAARSVGGVSEILRHGEFGTLISEATPTAVAQGITTVIERPLSPTQREAASRSVVASFGVDRLVDDVDRLYRNEWRRAVGGELR